MGDRYNIHSQLEHLQSKYIGTGIFSAWTFESCIFLYTMKKIFLGHADTTKYEWLTNQHRDSLASYIGRYDMLSYFSIVENETKARVKFNLMEKLLQPCGPPPMPEKHLET